MKKAILGSVIIASCPNYALADTKQTVSFSMENDGIVQQDKNYTNGIFLDYASAASKDINQTAPSPFATVASWLPLHDDSWQGWRISLGQQMWTPSDITLTTPQPNERPYAGLLYLDFGVHQFNHQATDKLTLKLGTVGPNSFAEDAQKFVHRITPSEQPKGWDYQIDNQVIVNLNYEGQRLLHRASTPLGRQWEFTGVGRLDVGNFRSEAAIGGMFRWGKNLTDNMGAASFSTSQFSDVAMLSASQSGYFLFAGVEGRYRFNDITIEGDKPQEVDDVTLQHWQAGVVAGVTFYRQRWGINLTMAANSKNYQEDNLDVNLFGAFKIFYRY
ncbi:lipid A deacylase LpxR family protein [Photobacterium jeanii]|uniref:lipid A deacylase LpxR family protein n=1 Tax=Photobacterium jeanii TaxID=858640 RepID=UPI001E5778AF|nr:lipid A deacylase LpxR family protein [Photobacterium jeanii]